MYKIVMTSWGGTRRDFMCGFTTFREAQRVCEEHNWIFEDGGYIWDLEVEEDSYCEVKEN